MAITHVGDAAASGSQAAPGPTVTYSSTGGNTLIASGSWYAGATVNAGITQVTDSAGNIWQYATSDSQKPPSAHNLVGGNYYGVFVAWTIAASAVTSVTVKDGTGNADFWRVIVSEWSGIVVADAGTASASPGPVNNPSATVSLFDAGELVVAAADSISGLPSAPAGATEFPSDLTTGNVYELPGVAGPLTFTWTAGSVDYAIAMMSFSPVLPPVPVYQVVNGGAV